MSDNPSEAVPEEAKPEEPRAPSNRPPAGQYILAVVVECVKCNQIAVLGSPELISRAAQHHQIAVTCGHCQQMSIIKPAAMSVGIRPASQKNHGPDPVPGMKRSASGLIVPR